MSDAQGSIRYVVWELTLRCDLACDHCGSRAGRPRENELTTEEALAVVAQLRALGVIEVTLIGGEAYLHAGFEAVARAIVAAGIRCGVGTGGRGITRERARLFADIGVCAVGVSIDGDREAHDLQRGVRGSYDSALAAVDNLREAGVSFGFNTQINRVSAAHLEAVYELLVAKGGDGWQLQITVPMGRAADRPEWLLQPYELIELFPRLAALAARATERGIVFQPANVVGYFGPYQVELKQGDPERVFRGCPAGHHGLGIEADGGVKGCPSLPSEAYRGGTTRDASLRDLVAHAPELRFTREDRTRELWGYCARCYYGPVCQGGCSWMAHALFGRRGNNPYCHHRALELQREGLRERVVLRARAPGPPFDYARSDLVPERWGGSAMDEPVIAREPVTEEKRRRLRVVP